MSERITVFDIEVLNQDPASVCAIGIVELLDGQEVSSYYSLIQPKNMSFDSYRYRVHKIKIKSLLKEKPFPEVWKEIKHYFEDKTVISHDIQGDMMNLRQALKQNQIPYPKLRMSCTNVIAHLIYPDLPKYNLATISNLIGFNYTAHHALEDARACGNLLMYMINQRHFETLDNLHKFYRLDYGEMKENYYRNIMSPDIAIQLTYLSDKTDAFLYHQSICFTGKLSIPKETLEEETKKVSAVSTHQVSTQTNYLVVGKKGYHRVRFGKENKKVQKALKLMKQGQDLKIIHENEFIKLLNEKRS